jgi:hypothetical protein
MEEGTPQERKKTNKRKHRDRENITLQAQPSKEKKGDIPLGYSRRTALRRAQCDMTPESRNSGGRAWRPLLDNGSVIMFPWQRIRLKNQCIAYRVTSISGQRIQKRFNSHGNKLPKHNKSEECDKSTVEGRDLYMVRLEPTSGRELTNRNRIRHNTEDVRKESRKSEVKSLVYVVLSLFLSYEAL